MRKIKFGEIVSYDWRTGKGIMNIPGEPVDVTFELENLRNVACGFSEPELQPITDWSKISLDIAAHDTIVAVVKVEFKLEVKEGSRRLYRAAKAEDWAYAKSYVDARRIIANRPVYEVVEFRFYNGKPTSVNQREVLNFGTAIGLQAVYPRGAENDPLAPEKKCLGFSYRRRFYRREGDKRIQCPDPRPLPPCQKEEPFQPTNEQGELIATPREVAIKLGGRIDFHRSLAAA